MSATLGLSRFQFRAQSAVVSGQRIRICELRMARSALLHICRRCPHWAQLSCSHSSRRWHRWHTPPRSPLCRALGCSPVCPIGWRWQMQLKGVCHGVLFCPCPACLHRRLQQLHPQPRLLLLLQQAAESATRAAGRRREARGGGEGSGEISEEPSSGAFAARGQRCAEGYAFVRSVTATRGRTLHTAMFRRDQTAFAVIPQFDLPGVPQQRKLLAATRLKPSKRCTAQRAGIGKAMPGTPASLCVGVTVGLSATVWPCVERR